jgi:hypothetical protein
LILANAGCPVDWPSLLLLFDRNCQNIWTKLLGFDWWFSIQINPHKNQIRACFWLLGCTEDAFAQLLEARARNPLLWIARIRLAALFGHLGEREEARSELAAARALVDSASRADLATLAAYRSQRVVRHSDFISRATPTLYAGLLKAGMAEA